MGIIYTKYSPAGLVNERRPADTPTIKRLLIDLLFTYLNIYKAEITTNKVE